MIKFSLKYIFRIILWLAICFVVSCNSFDKSTEVTPEKAKTEWNDKKSVIIDVRDYNEYEEGHITGVKLIPVWSLEKRAPRLLDKKKRYIAVCRTGKRRSKQAVKILRELGYDCYSMHGGMNSWKEKSFSIQIEK